MDSTWPLSGQITVSGDVNGTLSVRADSSCSSSGPGEWMFIFHGALAGRDWSLVITFGPSGPGDYDNIDAGLGPPSAAATYVAHIGMGDPSTITVGPDGRSGSLDLRLQSSDGARRVRVVGTFTCGAPLT